MKSAAMAVEIAIVGGGVLGASIAWHLADLGARDVVLFERSARPGEGSTGRATGGFRAQFASPLEVRLSLLSREKLRRFADEVGVDPGYETRGYLWLARTPAQLDLLRAAHAVQLGCGLAEARLLVDSAEIRALNPAVRGDFAGAAFCPTDGVLRPLRILEGYLRGAERRGARVRFGAPVEAFRIERGRVAAVRAGGEEIPCGAAVIAAGAFSAAVGRMAGIEVEVSPLRRQVALTAPTDALPEGMPMTIFLEDGFHLRVRDGRVLLLLPTPGNPEDPFDTSVESAWLDRVGGIARERVPALSGVSIDREGSWAGLYEMTPDHRPLLGWAPEVANLFLACGCSGHGVMHSPALGQLAAEMLLGRAPSLDASALRPGRFREGAPEPISALL